MFKAQNEWGTAGDDNGYLWISYQNVQNYCLNEVYRIHPGCASDIYISNSLIGVYTQQLKESNTWIRSKNQTTVYQHLKAKLDADPVNGYVLFAPVKADDFLLSSPAADGHLIAQALDGCGFNVPMKGKVPLKNVDQKENLFTVSPNPAKHHVTVRGINNLKNASVELIDLSGRKQTIHTDLINDFQLNIYWDHVSTGLYILKVHSDTHQETHKLIISN